MGELLKRIDAVMKKWRRSWNYNLKPWQNRLAAWFDMLVFDHGILRCIYSNRFSIAPGVERSNHPSPVHIAAAARRGVKTIINLRGRNDYGSYALSKRACSQHGIQMIDFRLKSRQLPRPEQVLEARQLFAKIDYPVLMHCKSGADRVGLMAALYCIFCLHQPVETAMRQLGLKYGHVRASKTGVLVFFLRAYCQANASDTVDFATWVRKAYNPDGLTKQFRPNGWASWLVDCILHRE